MMISLQGLTDLCPPKYDGIIQQLKIKAAPLNSTYDQANFSPFTLFLKTWEKLTQVFASNDMANYIRKEGIMSRRSIYRRQKPVPRIEP